MLPHRDWSKVMMMLGFVALALDGPGAEPVATATWMDGVRQPADWLNWGAEIRMRHEYYDNATTFDQQAPNDEVNYQRYRARLWLALTPCKPITLNARMVTESRWYLKPDTRKGAALDEFLVDTLNVAVKLGEDHPLTLTFGRQDLTFGNLWLFHDGTTRDGSRSDFVDAARVTYDREDWHTVFNLAAFEQTTAADKHFPMINGQAKALAEENSHGGLLYVINRAVPGTQIDGYFLYKHDQPALPMGNRGNLYLFGARVERQFAGHWRWRTEFAPEFGDRNGRARQAIGWNNLLTFSFSDAWHNDLHLGCEYLSGNDPGTGADEGFDPVWGRRAQFSELLGPTFGVEAGGRSSEWTNLQRLGLGWRVHPTRKLEILADYHALWANENSLQGVAGYSAVGKFRGHLATGVLKYAFNDSLSGHLWAEIFFPGDYYAEPKGDRTVFLRVQLICKF